MELMPETAAALAELEASSGLALGDRLRRLSELVQQVVPDCWGLSISILADGLTFTLISNDQRVAALDAVQYLESGPCVTAIELSERVRTDDLGGPLDEAAWHLFAAAGAAAGVRSTLSFPLRDGGRVVGGVNLYAASVGAFTGREDAVAVLVSGWAGDTVSNADLDFSTRRTAISTPARLADRDVVNQATGMLLARSGGTPQEALHRLADAAARAGSSVEDLARAVVAGTDPA